MYAEDILVHIHVHVNIIISICTYEGVLKLMCSNMHAGGLQLTQEKERDAIAAAAAAKPISTEKNRNEFNAKRIQSACDKKRFNTLSIAIIF